MKRGYRANNIYSFTSYFNQNYYADFSHDMCGPMSHDGLESMAGAGKVSNPYKNIIDQGMKGDTYIMNPSENVGNPYNLIKKGQDMQPRRIRRKTPVMTLRRGDV